MKELLKKEIPLPRLRLPKMPQFPQSSPKVDFKAKLRRFLKWFRPTEVTAGQLWRFRDRNMRVQKVEHGFVHFLYNYPHIDNKWREYVESMDYFKLGSTLLEDID